MTRRSYGRLDAWQRAMELVEAVYVITRNFPDTEKYGLVTQLQRAAVSIPANIAEGYGRTHRGEYLHHLSIARGSLFEVETLLTLAVRLKLAPRQESLLAWDLSQQTGRLLTSLIASLRRDGGSSAPQTPDPRP